LAALSAGLKSGLLVGKTTRGKGVKVMAVTDTCGVVLSNSLLSPRLHEVTLVKSTLDGRFIEGLPEKLYGDKAYDIDPLDERLAGMGINLIAPHCGRRKREKAQDGRKLCR